jgi:hypothetical protein
MKQVGSAVSARKQEDCERKSKSYFVVNRDGPVHRPPHFSNADRPCNVDRTNNKQMIDVTKYTKASEYFWDQIGTGERIYGEISNEDWYDTNTAEIFPINAEEAEAFHLTLGAWFMIHEDSNGFVYGSEHATREAAETYFRLLNK